MDPNASPQSQQPPPTVASPPPLQPPLHQSDADEEDESVKQLNECSSLYLSLQDCLADTNRNWKSCQKQVQALKACNERRNKDKRNFDGIEEHSNMVALVSHRFDNVKNKDRLSMKNVMLPKWNIEAFFGDLYDIIIRQFMCRFDYVKIMTIFQ